MIDTGSFDYRARHALEPYGFTRDKYGEVPYDLVFRSLGKNEEDYSVAMQIVADHRLMGNVYFDVEGEAIVKLDLANWFNPKISRDFTFGKIVRMGSIPIRTDVMVPFDKIVIAKFEHGK